MHISKRTTTFLVFFAVFLGVVLSLRFPLTAFAQDGKLNSAIFGDIEAPPGVEKFNNEEGAGEIGILLFVSRVLRIGTIIAGLWTVANLLLAAYIFFSSNGKEEAPTKVKDVVTMSVVGLLLIITAYTITGILGLMIYGDAMYIINPKFEGPLESL